MKCLRPSLPILFALACLPLPLFAQGLTDLGPHQPRALARDLGRPGHWIAIVGDSGVTGAASRRDIEPRGWNLLGHAFDFLLESRMTADLPALNEYPDPARFGIRRIEPMTRVMYSRREYSEAVRKNEVRTLNLGAKGSLKVDSMENTFGYMVGHRLGVEARDIVLVGQDGKRISAIPEQFERIFEMNTKTLPPYVFVSFTANDFCDNAALGDDLTERTSRFADRLALAWKQSAEFLIAHPAGTRIVVLAPLEVANVLTNPEILRQEVNFQGSGRITCGQLRKRTMPDGLLTKKTSDSLVGMCKSVLGTSPDDTARLNRLRAIQSAFNEVWKSQVAQLNSMYSDRGLRFDYAEAVRHISFRTGDVANDCFHPSAFGHAKIADVVLETLRGK